MHCIDHKKDFYCSRSTTDLALAKDQDSSYLSQLRPLFIVHRLYSNLPRSTSSPMGTVVSKNGSKIECVLSSSHLLSITRSKL